MALDIKRTVEIREALKTLDFTKLADCDTRDAFEREFFVGNEGCKSRVYQVNGINHIGIGFNLEAWSAREDWLKAFGNGQNAPKFDDFFSGSKDARLTDSQVNALFKQSIASRDEQLEKIYGEAWKKIPEAQKFAIRSAYYTAETVVGKKTHFCEHMLVYAYAKDDKKAMPHALWELAFNSNPRGDLALQTRRLVEATMLNTENYDLDEIRKWGEAQKSPKPDQQKEPDPIPHKAKVAAMQAADGRFVVAQASESDHQKPASTPAQPSSTRGTPELS
jgi:hypothetical protein